MAKKKTKRVRVRALRDGYYDNSRRREGDVFDVKVPTDLKRGDAGPVSQNKKFNNKNGDEQVYDGWMEVVSDKTSLKKSTRDSKPRPEVPFSSAPKAWEESEDDEDTNESDESSEETKTTGSQQVI